MAGETPFPQKYNNSTLSKYNTWGMKGAAIQTSPLLRLPSFPSQEADMAVTELALPKWRQTDKTVCPTAP